MKSAKLEPGYHLTPITQGEYGELSKLSEELEEVLDASGQEAKVMIVLELSDLFGAMEGYLGKHHPDTTMNDLKIMSDITKRAFRNGQR